MISSKVHKTDIVRLCKQCSGFSKGEKLRGDCHMPNAMYANSIVHIDQAIPRCSVILWLMTVTWESQLILSYYQTKLGLSTFLSHDSFCRGGRTEIWLGGLGVRGYEAADYLHEASTCKGQELERLKPPSPSQFRCPCPKTWAVTPWFTVCLAWFQAFPTPVVILSLNHTPKVLTEPRV